MRATVYARLSRPKDKAERGLNIEDQQTTGRQVVERRGWDLIDVFTDNGRGAYKDDARRAAWEAMLDAKPDVIVVRDEERLARRMREYVALLDTKAKVVAWLSAEGDVDLDAPLQNTDTDEFANKIVGARSYSRKIGAKVRNKVRKKAANGSWPHGGTRPFGYHHPGPKTRCCPEGAAGCEPGVVKPDEAAVILEVAARWLAGESLSALCRDLTKRGVKTPAGKPWQYARLRQMLAGPRIAGIRTYNGVETRGQWDAIVSDELHRRLVTAAAKSMKKRANENGSYSLTSIIKCGRCDRTMYGHRQHSTRNGERSVRLRYVCLDGCGQGIAVPQTDEFVASHSFFAMLAPELCDRKQAQRDLEIAREQVSELESRIGELDVAYWQERTITKDRWLAQSTTLGTALKEAQARLSEAKQRVTRDRDLPETAAELGERWRDADARERNRLLRLAVDRVVIGKSTRGGRFDPDRITIRFHDDSTYPPNAG